MLFPSSDTFSDLDLQDNEDYEQAFPEDAYGEECGPNARVFKVYHQEATTYDNDMISQLSDSSDVLLVFVRALSPVHVCAD